jgi:murein DD-endopeptidase MepM/ murein hydrolase activator NlpD
MLRSFKLRLLGVIVLVAVVGMSMQSGHSSRQLVEPVLVYMMDNQYDVGKLISRYVNIPGVGDLTKALPVSGGTILRQPCEFLDIEHSYGWHWNQEEKKQKYNPGIYLKVKDNTTVKPILGGQVMEINNADNKGTVLIKHDGNIFSLYGGLKDILVDKGNDVGEDELIGRTGESFYFEVRGKDGPVNPQSIFK